MRLVAIIRPSATVTVQGSGIGVEELRASVLGQAPDDHELAQLLVGPGRVDGDLVGTAVFRPTTTRRLEAEGADYAAARGALDALVPPEHHVLSVHLQD